MKTLKIFSILFASMAILFTSCSTDEGFGGDASITGVVSLATGGDASGAIVKIKYGATTATTDYDFATVAEDDGSYFFEGLATGDYVVFADYTNDFGLTLSAAGAYVKVGEKKAEIEVNLTVE
jgi:predicted small secreted protein